ncbi:MAG: DUF4145 domain-containing protein [Cloacibacillus sp.]
MNRPIDSYCIHWQNLSVIFPLSYTCPYCANLVSSVSGYNFSARMDSPNEDTMVDNRRGAIYICPHCQNPTIIFDEKQFPGIPEVKPVMHLPSEVSNLYEEARTCMSNGCFTATVMLCRKIIMNVAVNQGAETDKSFQHYVDFYDKQHLFHPSCLPLLDKIRKMGNTVNHNIEQTTPENAKQIITFTYQVLLYIYEIPGEIQPI